MKHEPFDMALNECAQLDADCQGHYLVVLANYHNYIDHQFSQSTLGAEDWGTLKYEIGNMEGRLFCNCWTLDDYEQASIWEQEMEEASYK